MDRNTSAILFAMGAVALWSTAASAFSLALDHGSPWQVVFAASIMSTLVFLAVVLRKGVRITAGMLPAGALRGFLNPFLYYLVLLSAYNGLPAQVAMVINYLWPLTLSLLAVPLLGQKLKPGAATGILVSFSGVVLMAFAGSGVLREIPLFPVLLAFFSTVVWALYWILNTRASGSVAGNLLLNFCFGTAYLLVWGLLTGARFSLRTELLLGGSYIGLFEMGVAFLFWNTALKRSDSASRVSGLIYITPFLSLGVIALVVKEPIAPATILGLLLVITGIALGTGMGRGDRADAPTASV